MLAKTARLQLPADPFHVPRWRQASLLSFTLNLHYVMRVSAELVASAKWLVRALLTEHPGAAHPSLPEWPQLGEALPGGSHSPCWLHSCPEETPTRLADWLAEHTVGQSKDLHLLTMAVGVLLSLLTQKTELFVRGVYGAGKTQCVALLAAFFALRGHQVYYAARANTTITFVHQLLPHDLRSTARDRNPTTLTPAGWLVLGVPANKQPGARALRKIVEPNTRAAVRSAGFAWSRSSDQLPLRAIRWGTVGRLGPALGQSWWYWTCPRAMHLLGSFQHCTAVSGKLLQLGRGAGDVICRAVSELRFPSLPC